ncbi:unnamed protein product [marine sediment metagenome]|uniref:Tyrosine specific protein phosphatases domain-containing protein n=1 Tax=marine sediment metagenome TaxID=412755 RepID=X0SWJ6_9ZZZZ
MKKIKFPQVNHDKIPKFEYNQIDDHIFIGTNMCCQTHFDEKLLEKDISADISLEEERLDSPFGAKFFTWIPTKDHTPPDQDQLKFGIDTINSLTKLGKKMYIHCKNGHGRAPSLVAAYYISQGMDVEEAIKKIQSKRKSIHLEGVQIKALEKFKKNLQ